MPVWRLTGTDRGDFTISAQGELTFRSIPDHERPADSNRDNVYSFAVQASDDQVLRDTGCYGDGNAGERTAHHHHDRQDHLHPDQENSISAVFYTFRAIDPEGNTVTWSTGGQDGVDFAIDGGALKFGYSAGL